MNERLLGIYLNDHLAGSVVGGEIARRCLGRNRGSPLGEFLARLVTEIDEDRASLEKLMADLGIQQNPVKRWAAFALEKAGWLKLNGGLFQYSDLSRLEELEALGLGLEGKRSLWRALAEAAPSDPRLDTQEMYKLADRASRQREELEQHRLEAARRALGAESSMA
jgi:hypothetical protein